MPDIIVSTLPRIPVESSTRLKHSALLKTAFVILLSLSFASASRGQNGEPQLLDKFERIPCSDFRGRIDSFLAEVSLQPGKTGYVALSASGERLDIGRRRTMIESQLFWRNFDMKRVEFVRREGLNPLEVEFWLVAPGETLPFEYDSKWSFNVPRGQKPFVLVVGGFDASECPESRDAVFVAKFLDANQSARLNVVIKCNDRNCFREVRQSLVDQIVGESGIERKRLRFFWKPAKSDYYEYEFWILN